jgi:hypothetical protein
MAEPFAINKLLRATWPLIAVWSTLCFMFLVPLFCDNVTVDQYNRYPGKSPSNSAVCFPSRQANEIRAIAVQALTVLLGLMTTSFVLHAAVEMAQNLSAEHDGIILPLAELLFQMPATSTDRGIVSRFNLW